MTDAQIIRYWKRVQKSDGCWLWDGKSDNSRGIFWIDRNGVQKPEKVHRIAYELTHGPIPSGLCVCHHCDTPPCCNPAHLFLGTIADNNADMRRKNRHASLPPMGGHNKITLPLEILLRLGEEPDYVLAVQCQASKKVIGRVRKCCGIVSYAERTGNTGTFKRGHYPSRWLKRIETP